jgi:hypothetical protein
MGFRRILQLTFENKYLWCMKNCFKPVLDILKIINDPESAWLNFRIKVNNFDIENE